MRFNFDEEEYLEKVDDFRQDLQEEKEKFLEENAQKAREAASRPKEDPAERANGFGNGNGGNGGGFKGGRPWKAKKEAKIKDNFIMGKGFSGEADHSLLEPGPLHGNGHS